VTTLAGSVVNVEPEQRRVQDEINTKNLRLLLKYHVKLALGSDGYRLDTVPEALYIDSLHVMSTLQLLNIWCTSTVETIFPGRKVGKLKDGYEASFLVLGANPIDNFSAVQQIRMEVKQGHILKEGD
jgi:imidazolonepropionase-like amidohydrolase